MKNLYRIVSIFIFILIASFSFQGCSSPESEAQQLSIDLPALNTNKFGFIDDSLSVERVLIENNQTLAEVLLPFGLPYNRILEMTETDKDIFNARKVVSGKYFTVYSTKDTAETVCLVVYEADPVNYVIFDFGDTLKVIAGKQDLVYKERTFAGKIKNSLFQTIIDQGVTPVLALKLADVFAWQIDFYRIQKGDYFKVIFDEIYVGDQLIDVGRIKASIFNHRNKDFYGFYFNQGDEYDYFDENGGSLRKAFLRAPLKFSRISSRFSNNRFHPVLKRYRAHHGVDYAAPRGTPVHAIGDGVVTEAHYKGGNGNYVKIRHNSTYQSGYLHLSKYGKGIKAGTAVKQGQIIGYVGSTGLSSGPHLDLRFWKNGQLLDYLKVEFPPSKPVNEEYKESFITIKDSLMIRLNELKMPGEKTVLAAADSAISSVN